MTFYLKYRSQTINDLDLDKVREQLSKIVASEKIPHAFLFTGPRGAGKTSAARILAKVVNCEARTNNTKQKTKVIIEPCNVCATCVAITRGSSLDVVEIDAASNRGVEDIRSLRETIKLAPISCRMKVYIIDEAHMLTTEASNALLKTLEEPPPHVMFILATTAGDKLLDTIRSRCTIINFHKGNKTEVTRALNRIVLGEDLDVENGVLEEIAKHSDGGFREAHKLLEQLSFEGGKITLESAKTILTQVTDPSRLLKLLVQKNAKGALEEIGEIVDKGINLHRYTVELLSLLREQMLFKMGVQDEIVVEGLDDIQDIKALIELLSEAARQISIAVIPQLPLELVVVKWCGVGNTEDLSPTRLPLNSAPAKGGTDSRSLRPDKNGDSDSPFNAFSAVKRQERSSLNETQLEGKWKEIMKKAKDKNHSLEALLRACKPLEFDGFNLKVEVFYPFHKERLEKELYRSIFENVSGEILGGAVKLECVLSTSKKRAADVVNVLTPKEEDILSLAEELFNGDRKIH